MLALALLFPFVSSDEQDDVAVSENTTEPVNVTLAQGTFRQKLIIGNGLIFDDSEVDLFQTLYAGYTVHYSVSDADVSAGDIITTCTVLNMELIANTTSVTNATLLEESELGNRKLLLRGSSASTGKRDLQDEEELPIEGMFIDYTVSYESSYYDVTHYEVLFQNWINVNLDFVVEGLQTLNFNVSQVETVSKLLDTAPTAAPSESLTEVDKSSPPTLSPSPTVSPPSKRSDNGLAVILSSFFIGVCIIIAGLLVYWKKRGFGHNNKNKPRRGTEGSHEEDVEKEGGMDSDKKVRIQEPTPSSSSASSKDGNDVKTGHENGETPTSGKHYDDWVHHYYKKKNEKKEQKKKRSSPKSRSKSSTSRPSDSKRDPSSERHRSRSTSREPESSSAPAAPPTEFRRSSGSRGSTSSMKTSLQRLEDQRPFLSEEQYEDRRRDILLAALS